MTSPKNVYQRFIEELDGMTIMADEGAVAVTGRLTRAVKRAQMVVDGELPAVRRAARRTRRPYR